MDQSVVGPGVPLTDTQWARIEPLLPDRTPKRGGRWRDHREVIDAIAYRFQTGTQPPWTPPHQAGRGPGRQGVLLARDPHPPEQTRYPRGDPGTGRSTGQPDAARKSRWQTACLRPGGAQAAQHRRTVHQPPQAVAWHRHPLREDRDHLPGRTPHRGCFPLVRR
ncbi:transposase [Streptomyces sp. TRM43335]|uniref:Transposase n=1 Tax=Streptomyces taklimakanensis TaxID=2569853 RepID=A0A6G2B6T1_9ACTN|nr:transposase [Streptomyces taklimakanensis]